MGGGLKKSRAEKLLSITLRQRAGSPPLLPSQKKSVRLCWKHHSYKTAAAALRTNELSQRHAITPLSLPQPQPALPAPPPPPRFGSSSTSQRRQRLTPLPRP